MDLITEKLVEKRDTTRISCDRGGLLMKVDSKFHHSMVANGVLVVNVAEHQGKYLCLEVEGYPSKIYYVQLSGSYLSVILNVSCDPFFNIM